MLLDYNLGETADMLRESVRNFAAKEIAPRAAEIDHQNVFPSDLWKKLGDWSASAVPTRKALP